MEEQVTEKCRIFHDSFTKGGISLDDAHFFMALEVKNFIELYPVLPAPELNHDCEVYINMRMVGLGQPNVQTARQLGEWCEIYQNNKSLNEHYIADLTDDLNRLAARGTDCPVIRKRLDEFKIEMEIYKLPYFKNACTVLEKDSRNYA